MLATVLLSARLASAACGDGVINAGEVCDPALPPGAGPCPGSCSTPPNLDACHCLLPSTDVRKLAVIAELQARVGSRSSVQGGGVAVTAPGGLVSVGGTATIGGEAETIGDRCKLQSNSVVGRLFCNEVVTLTNALMLSGGPFAFSAPLNLPPFPPVTGGLGGGSDITVAEGSTRYLAPGKYGILLVQGGGQLILHGGNSGSDLYQALALKVGAEGKLLVDNPVTIDVDTLRLTGNAVLAPNPAGPVQAGDLRINVAGARGARLGKNAFVQAHIHAPNGNIVIGRGTTAVGQFVAQQVLIRRAANVVAAGGCGDGIKQSGEVCDPTAPGGDAACQGNCIFPGQPGQCTCHCFSNADCNDHNACNGVETCVDFHCNLGTPLDCDDGNQCTNDCDPTSGCKITPLENGTSCDDHNDCTKQDTCQNGTCQPGQPRTCNDGNACTTDSCDPAHGCQHAAVTNDTPCASGNKCLEHEVCKAGQCVNGSAVDCNDLNPCTADACDPAVGCEHENVTNGISCAGASPCSALDACKNGQCLSGVHQLCGVSDLCTTVTCTATGPIGSQVAQCSSGPAISCNDLNPCTVDSCNPTIGCVHSPAFNGTSCAGPSPCTTLDVCKDGSCLSGVPQLCSDGNPCTIETCQITGPIGSQTAQCKYTNAADNTPCGPNGLECTSGVCQ